MMPTITSTPEYGAFEFFFSFLYVKREKNCVLAAINAAKQIPRHVIAVGEENSSPSI